jgi:hypothetical protein
MSALDTLAFQVREGVGSVWPLMVGSGAILVVAAIAMRRDRAAIALFGRGALALIGPWSLPLWATLTAGVEKGGRAPVSWASFVLFGLGIGALGLAIASLYRGRRYWYVFVPLVITVFVACFLGLFVGVMQIVDDWV